MKDEDMTDKQLRNAIFNVGRNIQSYKTSNPEEKKKSPWISLEVMEEREKELLREYNRRHKGELRYDGTVIGGD